MAIDCYPFDLGGIDLVLGYAWLLSMKRTTVDWETLTVEFEQEGRTVLIQGDPTLAMTSASFNCIQKLGQVEFGALIWETGSEISSNKLTALTDEPADDLQAVLTELCISALSTWIPRLLEEFHATPTGGHSGAWRTYKRLSANVFWPGMFKAVQAYVATCLICQKSKYEALTPAGLLQPLPTPQKVWEDISLDFIGGLLKSRGYDCILGAARMTPFEGVYGCKPPTLQQHLLGEFVVAGACHTVLVAWEGKPLEEATWMTCADFRAQFPLSILADKVCSIGGGIVSTAGKGQDPGAESYIFCIRVRLFLLSRSWNITAKCLGSSGKVSLEISLYKTKELPMFVYKKIVEATNRRLGMSMPAKDL
ncbi:hypothetical protein V2J09_000140 [Rumex salicifolius]